LSAIWSQSSGAVTNLQRWPHQSSRFIHEYFISHSFSRDCRNSFFLIRCPSLLSHESVRPRLFDYSFESFLFQLFEMSTVEKKFWRKETDPNLSKLIDRCWKLYHLLYRIFYIRLYEYILVFTPWKKQKMWQGYGFEPSCWLSRLAIALQSKESALKYKGVLCKAFFTAGTMFYARPFVFLVTLSSSDNSHSVFENSEDDFITFDFFFNGTLVTGGSSKPTADAWLGLLKTDVLGAADVMCSLLYNPLSLQMTLFATLKTFLYKGVPLRAKTGALLYPATTPFLHFEPKS